MATIRVRSPEVFPFHEPYLALWFGIHILQYSGVILIPAAFWRLARHNFLSVKWGWVACAACAAHGLFQRVTLQPHALNVGYGFPFSRDWVPALAPLVFAGLAHFRERQNAARLGLAGLDSSAIKSGMAVLLGSLFLFTGCKAPKIAQHRGWIGGEYKLAKAGGFPHNSDVVRAFPPEVKRTQNAGILVTRLSGNTPAQMGGLREGDLILKVGQQPVETLPGFWKTIDDAPPGSTLSLTVFRDGATVEEKVVVGRETFERWHSIGLGVLLSHRLDPWPNCDFSLVALGYKNDARRIELRTPESRFIMEKPLSSAQPPGSNSGTGLDSREGWEVWLALVSFGGHRRILSQEPF